MLKLLKVSLTQSTQMWVRCSSGHKVTLPQPLAQPPVHTGLVRVPLAPWTSRVVTVAPVRDSLPASSDRARLHRECPAARPVLSEWNP